MRFGHLLINPTALSALVATALVAGGLLWWLVRMRQKRARLPTVRILELEARFLPRLVWRRPPWLMFLCFLICALAVLAFSLQPRTEVYTPFEPDQSRVHVFVDYSPSVSAHASAEKVRKTAREVLSSFSGAGRLTVSTSHGPEIHEVGQGEGAESPLEGLEFHRGGLRLGQAMKQLMERLGPVDRLVIVSDGDRHSWSGFNWKYLVEETEVYLQQVGGFPKDGRNLYIHGVRFLSAPESGAWQWDVDIGRRRTEEPVEGHIQLSSGDVELARNRFRIPAGDGKKTQRVTVSSARMAKRSSDSAPLVWSLEAEGDRLSLDDTFRTRPRAARESIMVVSEPAGERMLEDPIHQLRVAAESIGFRVDRRDEWVAPGPKPRQYPLWLVVAGGAAESEHVCPSSLENLRLAVGAGEASQDALPKVWLSPTSLQADYGELCRCYFRLLESNSADEKAPRYCEDVTTRDDWVQLLPSLGARQIGGELGTASGALAFVGTDRDSSLSVLAFTVPLTPRLATGITHGRYPLLIKELLRWHGVLEEGGNTPGDWPRIADVAARMWPVEEAREDGAAEERSRRLGLSNVPVGESLLASMAEDPLPPRLSAFGGQGAENLPLKKDREDPLPWIQILTAVIVAFCALEALVLLFRMARGTAGRTSTGLWLVVLAAASLSRPAKAQVALNVLAQEGLGRQTVGQVAREVSQRTSIELNPEPRQFSQLGSGVLERPWMWVEQPGMLTNDEGHLKTEVALWLKRGGFLIIENTAGTTGLADMTAELVPPKANEKGWRPIPPDHELMRSFYLLDSLPTCQGQGWRGFRFDGRLAALAVPYGFLKELVGGGSGGGCPKNASREDQVRIFVNTIMVALATDYKKDQIHLPEILKRLR